MGQNINWKEIAIQILKTIWPVLAGAFTGTTISLRQCRHHDEQQTRRKGIQAQLGPVGGGVMGEEKRHQQAFGKSDDIPLRAAIRQIAARIRLIARSESAADGHIQHLTPGVGGGREEILAMVARHLEMMDVTGEHRHQVGRGEHCVAKGEGRRVDLLVPPPPTLDLPIRIGGRPPGGTGARRRLTRPRPSSRSRSIAVSSPVADNATAAAPNENSAPFIGKRSPHPWTSAETRSGPHSQPHRPNRRTGAD